MMIEISHVRSLLVDLANKEENIDNQQVINVLRDIDKSLNIYAQAIALKVAKEAKQWNRWEII